MDNGVLQILEARTGQPFPGTAYKLTGHQFGLDSVFSGELDLDEKRMAAWIVYADGSRRDGVGDLLEVQGIDDSRHRLNPIHLFDHGKHVQLPIGKTEDPETGLYTGVIDPATRMAKDLVFFWQGRSGLNDDPRFNNKASDHALFCEQVFHLLAQKYLRGGSIGYQIKQARRLQGDVTDGTPPGLHLLQVLKLESSTVVLPANGDTVRKELVRKMLAMPAICGRPPSPYLVKSLTPYAPEKKAVVTGGHDGGTSLKDLRKKYHQKRLDVQFFRDRTQARQFADGLTRRGCNVTRFTEDKATGQWVVYYDDSGRCGVSEGELEYADTGDTSRGPPRRFHDARRQKAVQKPSNRSFTPDSVALEGKLKPGDTVIARTYLAPGKGPLLPDGHTRGAGARSGERLEVLGWDESGSGYVRLRVRNKVTGIEFTVAPNEVRKGLEQMRTKAHTQADETYAQAARLLRSYVASGIDGVRQQAWDRLASLNMNLSRIPKTREGAERLLDHLGQMGVKSLDVRRKYRSPGQVRHRHRKSVPGVSTVLVSGKDLANLKSEAERKGLKFERVGVKDGLEKVRLTGDDDSIDSVAKMFGNVKSMGSVVQTKAGESQGRVDELIDWTGNEGDRNKWVVVWYNGSYNPDRHEKLPGVYHSVTEAQAALQREVQKRRPSGGYQRHTHKSLNGAGKAMSKSGRCGEMVLSPDDIIRPCILPKGHSGYHDTGAKSMSTKANDAATDKEEGGDQPHDFETEKHGAKLLRKMHADHSYIMEDYDKDLQMLENEHVKKHVEDHLRGVEKALSATEKLFGKHYKDYPGLVQDGEEGDGDPDPGDADEGQADDEAPEETDKDLDTMDDAGNAAASDDRDDEAPSDEEAAAAMQTKSLSETRARYGGKKAKAAKKSVCPGCGKEDCTCQKALDARPNRAGAKGLWVAIDFTARRLGSVEAPTEKEARRKANARWGVAVAYVEKAEDDPYEKEKIERRGKKDLTEDEADAVADKLEEETADTEPQEKALDPHELDAVKAAAGFLGEAQEAGEWTREHQMNSYHYHKTLEGIGTLGEAHDALENGTDVPPAEFEPGAGAKSAEGETGTKIGPLAAAGIGAAVGGMMGGDKSHRKMCKDASDFFKELSDAEALDDGHRQRMGEVKQMLSDVTAPHEGTEVDMGAEPGEMGEKDAQGVNRIKAFYDAQEQQLKELVELTKALNGSVAG